MANSALNKSNYKARKTGSLLAGQLRFVTGEHCTGPTCRGSKVKYLKNGQKYVFVWANFWQCFGWLISSPNYTGHLLPLGPKLLHYITLLFRIHFPDYVIIFYITELVLKLFPRLYNFCCCFKVYHVDIGLHYIIVFEIIPWLCNLSLHYRIGFELIM